MHQLVLNRQTKLLALLLIATFNVQASAESIGGVLEQSGSVAQIQRDRENIPAVLDESIASMDEVETKNGRLKIKFVDDTLVSLTEHTYMVIDEYVYDPNPSKSKMALNFVSGTADIDIHVSWLNPEKVRKITIITEKKMILYDEMDLEKPIKIFDNYKVNKKFTQK